LLLDYHNLSIQVANVDFLVEDDLRFKTSAEKVKAIKMGNTKAEENSESSGWVSFYPKISLMDLRAQ
jgi:hypothetical protein